MSIKRSSMITERQLKMIWVLARQVGLDDEGLHEVVLGLTGKDSLKKLTGTEVKTVVEKLTKAGAVIREKRKAPRDLPVNVIEIITPKQKHLIGLLEAQLGWQETPNRLKGLSKRIIKKENAATKEEATRLILAMKEMVNKKMMGKPVEGFN